MVTSLEVAFIVRSGSVARKTKVFIDKQSFSAANYTYVLEESTGMSMHQQRNRKRRQMGYSYTAHFFSSLSRNIVAKQVARELHSVTGVVLQCFLLRIVAHSVKNRQNLRTDDDHANKSVFSTSVDGRCIRINKVADTNLSGIVLI